ncbi:MAG: hypothetical protein AAF081_06665 [Actinomycetota bacterium]
MTDPETGRRLVDSALVEFAVTARVDGLIDLIRSSGDDAAGRYAKRANFAERLEMTASNFSQALPKAGEARTSSGIFVERLQRLLTIEETRWGLEAGDLVNFRDNVLRQHGSEGIRVPADYFKALTPHGARPRAVEELLIWVASLAAIRAEALEPDDAETLHQFADTEADGSAGRVARVLDDLVTTIGTVDGERTAAVSLASELKEWALPAVRAHLLTSPVGWRAAAVLTRMLTMNAGGKHRAVLLRERVGEVMEEAAHAAPPTVDPARCFLEEAMRRSPAGRRVGSSHPDGFRWGWVPSKLNTIASDQTAPIRQRGFAALVLAERDESLVVAADLAGTFRGEVDPTGGLEHCAHILERLAEGVPGPIGSGHWSGSASHDFLSPLLDSTASNDQVGRLATGVAATLAPLPRSVASATPLLIEHALLNIDVSTRRRVCEAVIAAGLTTPVSARIASILEEPTCPAMIQDIGCVVLGYLGDPFAIELLVRLARSKSQDTQVRNAALAALGDMRSDPDQLAEAHLVRALHGKGTRATKAVAAYGLINQARRSSERLAELHDHFDRLDESATDTLGRLTAWARECSSQRRLAVPSAATEAWAN